MQIYRHTVDGKSTHDCLRLLEWDLDLPKDVAGHRPLRQPEIDSTAPSPLARQFEAPVGRIKKPQIGH